MDVFLLAWLLVPLLLTAVSLGCGLLVAFAAERTGAGPAVPFPGLLVVPIGFAAVVVIASLMTTLPATAPLTGVAVVVFALAGLALGRARLRGWWGRRRAVTWPLLAALLPGCAVAAPVVLTGRAGLTGYTRITDLGHQIDFIEYLREHGREQLALPTSSFEEAVDKLVSAGYPGGTQSVVAAMGDLAHIDVAWAYQPVLAFVAAMLGITLFALLQRAIASPRLRALAAGVAAQPTILYAYTLAGGVKEISGAATVALAGVVLAERRPRAWSTLVPGAVAIAAAFSIFSLTILPWVGVVFATLAVFELVRERARVRTALRWAGVWGLAALLAAPAVAGGYSLLQSAGGQSGPEGLGNLAAPVPAWAVAGPWITADHRFPLARYGHPRLTELLVAVALGLAAVGLVAAARARDRGLTVLGVAGAVAVAYIVRNSGTWVQLKAFCMTAPIALALAFGGAAHLSRLLRAVRPMHLAGLGAGAAVALGVLYGNALQYHATTLVPYERMTELERIDQRFAGQGPALAPDFDDFAEYFLRRARGSGLVDPWRSTMLYNRLARPGLLFSRDTDEYDIRFLQGFRLIVRRRDPTASRPPGNWRLAALTAHYEVWRRVGDSRAILAHFPLKARSGERSIVTNARPGARSARYCRSIARAAASAGPGARVRYVVPADASIWLPTRGSVPRGWLRIGDDLHAGVPGVLRHGFTLPATERFRLFLRGSIGRRVSLEIDGRQIGSLRWRESYGGQYEPLGTATLRDGAHRLEIVRRGSDLLPGTGNDASGTTTTIGPLVLVPVGARERMHTIPAARAGTACRSATPMDWIEVLRPSGRSGRSA